MRAQWDAEGGDGTAAEGAAVAGQGRDWCEEEGQGEEEGRGQAEIGPTQLGESAGRMHAMYLNGSRARWFVRHCLGLLPTW